MRQKEKIKERAVELGLIPNVPRKPGTMYADFETAGLVIEVVGLPKRLWKSTDNEQFIWLDQQLPNGRPEGTTWHHSEVDGRMELVPFGIHNATYHKGGRSDGHWAEGSRS